MRLADVLIQIGEANVEVDQRSRAGRLELDLSTIAALEAESLTKDDGLGNTVFYFMVDISAVDGPDEVR